MKRSLTARRRRSRRSRPGRRRLRRLRRGAGRRRRRRRRDADHQGRAGRAARAREEVLQGAEARVPEGRHARVPVAADPGRRVPRPARRVRARGGGARHRRSPTSRSTGRSTRSRSSTSRTTRRSSRRARRAGLHARALRDDIGSQLITEEIYDEVTKDVKVTDDGDPEVLRREQDRTTRSPRRARCATSSSRRRPRPTRSTAQLRAAATSRRSRRRTRSTRARRTRAASSRSRGARPCAPFDKAAFLLTTNELSAPVKTEFGYHLIQPLGSRQGGLRRRRSRRSRRRSRRSSSRSGRTTAVNDWVEETQKSYEDKVAVRGRLRAARDRRPTADETTDRRRVSVRRMSGAEALSRAPGADPAPAAPSARGIASRPPARSSRTRSRRPTRSPTPRSPTTRRSSSTSSATCSSRSYFLALLLEEQGRRRPRAVARAVHAKLVRRHPHVFGDAEARTAGRVRERWEAIKTEQEGRSGVFHDVPETLPALLHARKVQRRAAAVGFDWPDLDGPAREGARGARRARTPRSSAPGGPRPRPSRTRAVEAELGDLLFTVVNLARVRERRSGAGAPRARRGGSASAVELAERLAAEAGETWAELDLDGQERWYERGEGRSRAAEATEPGRTSLGEPSSVLPHER